MTETPTPSRGLTYLVAAVTALVLSPLAFIAVDRLSPPDPAPVADVEMSSSGPSIPSTRQPWDPYGAYLASAPARPADWAAEWPLPPEDAQARAMAGCGQEWAPGTIDAALAAAYAELCR